MKHLSLWLILLLLCACTAGESGLSPGQERLSNDEATNTAEMISQIKKISLQRDPSGVIKRFNQSKTLGCFDATFSVPDNLPIELQQGIFAQPAQYPAQLRFANATQQDDREKDFRGLSIKITSIPGQSLWGEHGTQDFLLNSYPALFAANPEDFLDFIIASGEGKVWRYFINPSHFYSLAIVMKGREEITNPLAINYYSTTPFRFGNSPETAVKYAVRPCQDPPNVLLTPHENFLSETMRSQVASSGACMEFLVQFQADADKMPVENAAVVWDESLSPFRKVATLDIDRGAAAYETGAECEQLTFNPWQSLRAHQPLGGINRVRKPVYAEIGDFRTLQNLQRGEN